MADTASVLVVDDDASSRDGLILGLENHGYRCTGAATGLSAITRLEQRAFDFILCHAEMPRLTALSFVRSCKETAPRSVIILMTGTSDNACIVEAIKQGVHDCIKKPVGIDELLLVLRKAAAREFSEGAVSSCSGTVNLNNIVAKSKGMLDIFDTIKRLANYNTTVLIRGESGTGKELLARAIHNNSPRRGKPFIAINCGAIPENLMESELFGHQRGAFTDATRDKIGLFEEAHGGTIFLDEIGEMPLHLQVKLLRVLQEQQIQRVGDEKIRSIDVRVIAATLRDLEEDVFSGRFRDDLLYRLNVVAIDVPPLRARPDDIEILAYHFLKKHNKKLGLRIRRIHPKTIECLKHYHWKGNVRELENCIEHAMVLTESGEVDLESLPEALKKATSPKEAAQPGGPDFDGNLSIKQRTRDLEIKLIVKALEKTKGNRTHAAKELEISHRALLYKLKEYNLERVGKKPLPEE